MSLTLRGVLVGFAAQSIFSIHDACAKWLASTYSVYQVISMQAVVSGSLVALALVISAQASRSAISDPRRPRLTRNTGGGRRPGKFLRLFGAAAG